MIPTLPAPFWEYLAAFQVFKNLGFSADDIHFAVWPSDLTTAAQLNAQEKEFLVATGTLSQEEFLEVNRLLDELEAFARTAEAKDVNEKCRETTIYQNRALLVGHLLQDGFRFPYKLN